MYLMSDVIIPKKFKVFEFIKYIAPDIAKMFKN